MRIDSTHGHIENMISLSMAGCISGKFFSPFLKPFIAATPNTSFWAKYRFGPVYACFSHVGDQRGYFIASIWTIIQCVFVTDIAQRM